MEPADLPKLSWAAFAGDAAAVRRCLADGADVHQAVCLVNQNSQEVQGVTPLYLAAQNGHLEVCRELLRAGADVLRACAIPATGETSGPTDIALVHFHLRTWWVLNEAKFKRLKRAAARRAPRGGAHLAQPLICDSPYSGGAAAAATRAA
ncbi:MAG: hypothetical protein J3K34DRAFT_240695 [Monoraphidium minutum]|nr:MAG: hypothetical protein J3K34DRAFT_240695 [Monoraphidium minutum]